MTSRACERSHGVLFPDRDCQQGIRTDTPSRPAPVDPGPGMLPFFTYQADQFEVAERTKAS
jgi:hypothetical protein